MYDKHAKHIFEGTMEQEQGNEGAGAAGLVEELQDEQPHDTVCDRSPRSFSMCEFNRYTDIIMLCSI